MTHDAEVTDTRPVFVIPVLPAEVPAALLALPNEAGVLYVNASMAGLSGSGVGRAAGLVESIRQTIERQRKGRFWLHEAAQILADAHGLDAPQLLRRMKEAFRLGGLRVRDPATGTLRIPGEVELTFHNMFVTPADIDGWLTQDGADYRFPVAPHTASASPAALPEAVAAPAKAVLVTPKGVQKREMVRRYVAHWPTIETDMKDAATNGLADAAKAGKRGWREAAALEWARVNGRFLSAPEPGTIDAVMAGGFQSRRHTLAR